MRIFAGKHKGRNIESLKGDAVRPTSGQARESIFNMLMHSTFSEDSPLIGKKVLDVCCGTGAMGLEALSRGAAQATFIDFSREALDLARRNADRFGEGSTTHFLLLDATRMSRAKYPYDLIFIDPPYQSGALPKILNALLSHGWLAPGATLVIECAKITKLDIPGTLEVVKDRHYGKARVVIVREVVSAA